MDTYIYVHHKGHFNHPDSRSKVSLKTKQKNFLELFYDVTNSLPMISHGNDNTCKKYEKYSYDYCVTDVSKLLINLNFLCMY